MTLAARFADLFDGRRDAWGALEGKCVNAPLTAKDWEDHLWGDGSIGVYPLVPDDDAEDSYSVRWGCVDIDTGFDMLAQAKNLWRAYKHLGIAAWTEITKSKGYHVWTFFEAWVPAITARKVGIVACQLAGVLPKEVNPKQVSLAGLLGFGNYVNLPYARRHASEGKRVVLDPTDHAAVMDVSDFVAAATAARSATSVLDAAAELFREPKRPRPVSLAEYDGRLGDVTRRLNGLAWTIFTKGPLEGRDRSGTLTRLVHLCREAGLSPSEAYAVAWDADGRWGKYHERPDGELQVTRMVERAYDR